MFTYEPFHGFGDLMDEDSPFGTFSDANLAGTSRMRQYPARAPSDRQTGHRFVEPEDYWRSAPFYEDDVNNYLAYRNIPARHVNFTSRPVGMRQRGGDMQVLQRDTSPIRYVLKHSGPDGSLVLVPVSNLQEDGPVRPRSHMQRQQQTPTRQSFVEHAWPFVPVNEVLTESAPSSENYRPSIPQPLGQYEHLEAPTGPATVPSAVHFVRVPRQLTPPQPMEVLDRDMQPFLLIPTHPEGGVPKNPVQRRWLPTKQSVSSPASGMHTTLTKPEMFVRANDSAAPPTPPASPIRPHPIKATLSHPGATAIPVKLKGGYGGANTKASSPSRAHNPILDNNHTSTAALSARAAQPTAISSSSTHSTSKPEPVKVTFTLPTAKPRAQASTSVAATPPTNSHTRSPASAASISASGAAASSTHHKISKSQAARTIQAAWRGWQVRRHADSMRGLLAAQRMYEQALAKFLEEMRLGAGALSQKAQLSVNEAAMRVVLMLDGVSCPLPELRAVRKRLTRQALALQDQAAAAVAAGQAVAAAVKTLEDEPLQEQPAEHVKTLEAEPLQEQPAEHVKTLEAEPLQEQPAEHVKTLEAEPLQEQPAERVKTLEVEPLQEQPAEHVKTLEVEPLQEQPAEHGKTLEAEPLQEQPAEHVKTLEAEPLQEQPAEHAVEQDRYMESGDRSAADGKHVEAEAGQVKQPRQDLEYMEHRRDDTAAAGRHSEIPDDKSTNPDAVEAFVGESVESSAREAVVAECLDSLSVALKSLPSEAVVVESHESSPIDVVVAESLPIAATVVSTLDTEPSHQGAVDAHQGDGELDDMTSRWAADGQNGGCSNSEPPHVCSVLGTESSQQEAAAAEVDSGSSQHEAAAAEVDSESSRYNTGQRKGMETPSITSPAAELVATPPVLTALAPTSEVKALRVASTHSTDELKHVVVQHVVPQVTKRKAKLLRSRSAQGALPRQWARLRSSAPGRSSYHKYTAMARRSAVPKSGPRSGAMMVHAGQHAAVWGKCLQLHAVLNEKRTVSEPTPAALVDASTQTD